jgi:hypothetical protein
MNLNKKTKTIGSHAQKSTITRISGVKFQGLLIQQILLISEENFKMYSTIFSLHTFQT